MIGIVTPVPVTDNGSSLTVDATSLPLPTGAATAALQTQPGVDIGDVTVNNAAGASAVNIQDGGNSITIDAASLPLPTGAATAALQTQPGVDIGDVTINNGAAGAAVNIQDGGNTITVDGTVNAAQSGNWSVRLNDGTGNAINSVSNALNVNVASGTVVAQADPRQAFSQFSELMVAEFRAQTAWRFDYGVLTTFYKTTGTANGGTVTQDANRAKLSTSVATNGIARLQTIKAIRYLPGIGGEAKFTAVFSTPAASSTQYIGVGDANDRLFIGYEGTDFVVGRRRNGGADVTIPSGSWNGSAPSFTKTFGNIFKITYGWLGYQGAIFWIYDKTARYFKPMHYMDYADTSADVYLYNPTLPLFAEVANTGNNTDIVMYTSSAVGGTQGSNGDQYHSPLNAYEAQDVNATFSDSNNNHVVSIQNKSTAFAGGVANRVPVAIRSIQLSRPSSGSPSQTVRIYKDATTAGVRAYTDQDANNSPVSYSTTTTTITGGTSRFTYVITSNNTGRELNFDNGQLVLYPGEILTIAAQDSSNASTDIAVTVNWEDQF